jgi:hypothetical protein
MSTLGQPMAPPSLNSIARLPKLEANGANWTTYKDQVITYVCLRKLIQYLDGCAKAPERPTGIADPADPTQITPPSNSELEAWEDSIDEWKVWNASVKTLLYQTLHDSHKVKIANINNAATAWATLEKMYQGQGQLTQFEISTKMSTLRSEDGQDPRNIISELERLHQEHTNAGGKMEDSAYSANILTAMPPSYTPII